jgi:hypothetical protein
MKKSILIFCKVFTTFSLSVFGLMSWNNGVMAQEAVVFKNSVLFNTGIASILNIQPDLDLVYNIDSRFIANITKEDLHKATSVLDIVPKEARGWWKVNFQTVTVAVLQDGDEISIMGDKKILNAAQVKLLQATDYSTNFYINARTTEDPETGRIEDYVYYFTIIPEKEAEYTGGRDALIAYLKENSKEKTAIIKSDQLQPARVSFTVTKEGTIVNVKLDSTSGYPSVDETLVELITNLPEKWDAATNSKGEKVDQELVFFFGVEGC